MKKLTPFTKQAYATTQRLYKSRATSMLLSPRPYTALRHFAILPASLLLCITIFMASCSKNIEGGGKKSYNIIDKNYFFTVNINGKSYTSYGWYESEQHPDGTPYSSEAPNISTYNDIDPLSGDTIRNSFIGVIDHATNNVNPKNTGNCNAIIKLTKKGSKLGTYTLIKGPRPDHQFYNIDGKTYFIDQEGEQFNITRISSPGTAKPYVEGSFTCNVWEVNGPNTVPMPATGSFRLKGY